MLLQLSIRNIFTYLILFTISGYKDFCLHFINTQLSCFTDLQNVNITLRILFRPVVNELPKIYTNLGLDYDDRVLPSITNEVLKAVVVSRECILNFLIVRFQFQVLQICSFIHSVDEIPKYFYENLPLMSSINQPQTFF